MILNWLYNEYFYFVLHKLGHKQNIQIFLWYSSYKMLPSLLPPHTEWMVANFIKYNL